MYSDKVYRKKVVDNIKDPSVKSFWIDEYAKYTDRFAAEATPAIQNKIGQFTSNPLIRNIIGQEKSSFDFREVMDERKIVIINLSKGRMGEMNANLLGSMLITKIYLAALSRADVSDRELDNLPNFYLYVDEFQSFANESFAGILSEARKYKLNLTIAHQYIEQMSDEVRAAVFGNVGTMITFRVGSYDAEVLEKEFAPAFTSEDIVNLGAFQIYLRLMIDGIGSKPFSARTIPPLERQDVSFVDDIIQHSRERYGNPREEVEALILEKTKPSEESKKEKNDKKNNDRGNYNNSNKKTNNERRSNKERRAIEPDVAEQLKAAIKTGKVKEEKKEASLSDMTLLTQNGNSSERKKKEPSTENSNALRDALKGVIGNVETKEKKVEKQEKKKIDNSPKEIPEKELKDILGI